MELDDVYVDRQMEEVSDRQMPQVTTFGDATFWRRG